MTKGIAAMGLLTTVFESSILLLVDVTVIAVCSIVLVILAATNGHDR